jgi:hypothetical protein
VAARAELTPVSPLAAAVNPAAPAKSARRERAALSARAVEDLRWGMALPC